MNFDEWLKQGLDDAPGGDWDETKVDEVVSAVRKRRAVGGRPSGRSGAGPVSRRRSAALRTATVAAAAVVVAAGVIGGIVWNGQHTSANKGHSQTGVTNNTNQTSNTTSNSIKTKNHTSAPNFNAFVPSTTPPGSNTTPSLQMYDAGALTPVEAIAWPGLQKNSLSTSQLSVVQVPYTSATATTVMQAPQSISSSVPPQLSGKLFAYFVQMNQTTSFYLIAPAGMKGKSELAGDGSYSVYLHNADASIEVDTSGASVLAADGMAAPFFPAAATAAAQNVQGTAKGPLAPAVVSHPNAQTAYFSFRAKSGQDVAGLNDYLASNNLPTVRIVYTADAKDWSYAPYVLASANNLLSNVLAPQLRGTPVPTQTAQVTLGGNKYTLQDCNGATVKTPAGIAWVEQPPVIGISMPQSPTLVHIPTGPYYIDIGSEQSTKNASTLSTLSSQPIPWVHAMDADNNVDYAYPGMLTLINNQWLMYSIAWGPPGFNQPDSNDLHIFNLKTYQDTLVTSYLVGGGNFFAVGTSGDFLAYDMSYYTYNSVGGTLVHQPYLVNLATSTKTKLPSSAVVQDKSASSGFAVKTGVGGSVVMVPLQGWG